MRHIVRVLLLVALILATCPADAAAEWLVLGTEHHQVAVLAASLAGRGLTATPLLVQGPTVETILAESERLHADLIVVGSVSEGVVRGSSRPVLVVPARTGG